MDFDFSPEDEAYRQGVRQWLAENHPGAAPGPHGSPDWLQWARDWQLKAYEAGYVGHGWPSEYGGVEGSVTQQVVLTQEMVRARAPSFVGQMGMRMLGPYPGLWQDSDYVVDEGMWHYEHMFTLGLSSAVGRLRSRKTSLPNELWDCRSKRTEQGL